MNYVTRVPLGVVAQITPWNHPMLIAVKKIAPALATGNSIVLKPSELAPVSVLELGPLCSASGLPDGRYILTQGTQVLTQETQILTRNSPGVLNILPGLGPEVGQLVCRHHHVRKVDLTGGTNTGRDVGAAAGETHLTPNLAQLTLN